MPIKSLRFCTHSELQHLSGWAVGGWGGWSPLGCYKYPGCLPCDRVSFGLGPLACAASTAVLRLWCHVHKSWRLVRSWFPFCARFTIWSTSVPRCVHPSWCSHCPLALAITCSLSCFQLGGSLGRRLESQLCATGGHCPLGNQLGFVCLRSISPLPLGVV